MNRKVMAVVTVALCVLTLGVIAHAQKPADVAGTWTISQMGRNGVQMQTLVLMEDGMKLTGTLTGGAGRNGAAPMPIPVTGTIEGNNITFSFTRQGRNGEMMFTYKGTVDGANMKGTVDMNGNAVDWTAAKGS